ncbi:RNA polymerase-binding protein DksA [Buchnera aphidicola (Pemphigus obesinymphae)]|uniref:RNA polymerase-binding protein DksA n=1 Tax=Buchnera aphidicola TaxID=9 RepID=UPI002236FE52|nr:RNA polymerase-binding protein DksA [Buchnera aphidicola]MCW5196650.1 RNA polymerase-binding protein DksA [Buchnera aphidicola (Pemphigus obesinymphae)]
MKKEKNRKISSLSVLAMAGVLPYQVKKDEKYMNKNQINHFKKILEAWKYQLQSETNHITPYMKDQSSNFPDPVDRATQEEEFSIELRNRARESKLIKNIQITLKKVENKNFGYCDSCNIEIGIRRLEARPTANLCIDCKTLEEIRKKQMSG